ncbi:MAG TPA: 6-phosphogluconolactonase [Solirubrobacteraceae bacterium]|jgi:6-phosphogluconolactonase|nr:6-phosphogluconolactonase [Solirubrobacteraceae bacterium]
MTGGSEPPRLKDLVTVADAAAVGASAAELVASLIAAALAERGVAHVSLAGGTTPRLTYLELELDTWAGVELWFGDERCVGPDDPESNYLMVADSLLPHAPGALVHRIEGELGPDAAADAYATLIAERIPAGPDGVPVLDVNLLGIGPDGHTASLFPGNPALAVTGRPVVGVRDAPKPPPDRVSLTLEVLRAARDTILLASGESKADAVRAVLAGPSPGTPSSLLARDRLTLILDTAAAAESPTASPAGPAGLAGPADAAP